MFSMMCTLNNRNESSGRGGRSQDGGREEEQGGKHPVCRAERRATSGALIVPCKARGMDPSHDPSTAFFVIPSDIQHAQELLCSHPECKAKGARFQYCAICERPVASKNFTTRHRHDGHAESNESVGKNSFMQTTSFNISDSVEGNGGPSPIHGQRNRKRKFQMNEAPMMQQQQQAPPMYEMAASFHPMTACSASAHTVSSDRSHSHSSDLLANDLLSSFQEGQDLFSGWFSNSSDYLLSKGMSSNPRYPQQHYLQVSNLEPSPLDPAVVNRHQQRQREQQSHLAVHLTRQSQSLFSAGMAPDNTANSDHHSPSRCKSTSDQVYPHFQDSDLEPSPLGPAVVNRHQLQQQQQGHQVDHST